MIVSLNLHFSLIKWEQHSATLVSGEGHMKYGIASFCNSEAPEKHPHTMITVICSNSSAISRKEVTHHIRTHASLAAGA